MTVSLLLTVSPTGWLFHWLAGWLFHWLAGCFIGSLADCFTGWLAVSLAGCFAGWLFRWLFHWLVNIHRGQGCVWLLSVWMLRGPLPCSLTGSGVLSVRAEGESRGGITWDHYFLLRSSSCCPSSFSNPVFLLFCLSGRLTASQALIVRLSVWLSVCLSVCLASSAFTCTLDCSCGKIGFLTGK